MFAIAPYLVEVKDDRKQSQDLWDFYAKNNLRDVLREYMAANIDVPFERAGTAKKHSF